MTTEVTQPATTESTCCGTVRRGLESATSHTAALFKALSDETRLRILKSLTEMRELCECNIVPAFGLSQPTISYHLKVLREAGLIESERRGQWVYHRVNQRALLGVVHHLTEMG
jgi:ArsR family transcriptional regulator